MFCVNWNGNTDWGGTGTGEYLSIPVILLDYSKSAIYTIFQESGHRIKLSKP